MKKTFNLLKMSNNNSKIIYQLKSYYNIYLLKYFIPLDSLHFKNYQAFNLKDFMQIIDQDMVVIIKIITFGDINDYILLFNSFIFLKHCNSILNFIKYSNIKLIEDLFIQNLLQVNIMMMVNFIHLEDIIDNFKQIKTIKDIIDTIIME